MAVDVPTQFGDYTFLNRLEARWAVFFETLSIRFTYRQQSFLLEGLNNRTWTPDFHLPEFGDKSDDKAASMYISVFSRIPNTAEKKDAAYFNRAADDAAYLFYGPVGTTGGHWHSYKEETFEVAEEFAQCPFCGEFYIGSFKSENGTLTYADHRQCVAVCRFAEVYDIDTSFLDFTKPNESLPAPTKSPMLQIARSAAETIRFGVPESLAEVRGMRLAVEVLRENRIWASPKVNGAITRHAEGISRNEQCPRYREPTFLTHKKHCSSPKDFPCPCAECDHTRKKISRNDLEKMEAPKNAM